MVGYILTLLAVYILVQWNDKRKMGLWRRGAEEQRAISAKKEIVNIWRSADEQIPAKKERVDIWESTNERISAEKERVDIWRSTNEQIPKRKELVFGEVQTSKSKKGKS